MKRVLIFILLRLLALLGVLGLANVARALDPWSISGLILVGEALLGYTWGRAESRLTACKPKTPDPRRLFVLMACVAAVESMAAIVLVQTFAPWLIVWRVVTAYLPFVLVEFIVFRRMCRYE